MDFWLYDGITIFGSHGRSLRWIHSVRHIECHAALPNRDPRRRVSSTLFICGDDVLVHRNPVDGPRLNKMFPDPLGDSENNAEPAEPKASDRWIVGAFGALFFGLLGLEVLTDLTPARMAAVFFLVFWIPLTVLHEAGHAMMARCLGWKVDGVHLGFGRTWRTFSVGGIKVELKSMPIVGSSENSTKFTQARAHQKCACLCSRSRHRTVGRCPADCSCRLGNSHWDH